MGFEEIQERWHVIDGFENYAVTESGKVYSINPYHRGDKLRKISKRGIYNSKRYLSVSCCKDNKEYYLQIHRLVGKYFLDGYFDGAEIDHKDNDKHNNHYTNLEWVTHRENMRRSFVRMSPVRNFKLWSLVSPEGLVSPVLKGHGEIVQYIQVNNLDISISMLEKHKVHHGYKLINLSKNCND